MPGTKKLSLKKKVIMTTILIFLPFVLLEVAMRVLGYGGALVYEEDPVCGYRAAPAQRFSTMGHTITILSNSFRGPIETSDTLFVGDSVTYGCAFIKDDETFAARFGGVNAGVNGWGIQNVARLLETLELVPYERIVWTVPTCDILRGFTTLRNGLISTNRRMFFRLEYIGRFIWYGLLVTQPSICDPKEYKKNVAALRRVHALLKERDKKLSVIILLSREEALGEEIAESSYLSRLKEDLSSIGVDFHAVAPDANIEDLYRDSVHLSPEGHKWMAEQISQLIEKKDAK